MPNWVHPSQREPIFPVASDTVTIDASPGFWDATVPRDFLFLFRSSLLTPTVPSAACFSRYLGLDSPSRNFSAPADTLTPGASSAGCTSHTQIQPKPSPPPDSPPTQTQSHSLFCRTASVLPGQPCSLNNTGLLHLFPTFLPDFHLTPQVSGFTRSGPLPPPPPDLRAILLPTKICYQFPILLPSNPFNAQVPSSFLKCIPSYSQQPIQVSRSPVTSRIKVGLRLALEFPSFIHTLIFNCFQKP